jgi:hypothetical protein
LNLIRFIWVPDTDNSEKRVTLVFAYILQEMLTVTSDHIHAHYEVLGAIVTGESIPEPHTAPESFRLLVRHKG